MKNFSIKYQILLIAMVPVFLIDVFLTLIHINSSVQQAERLLQSKGEIIAKQIAGAAEFNLFSGSHDQIQRLLDQSINTNDIIFSAVYNGQGQPIAKSIGEGYLPEQTNQYFYYRQPIQVENISVGDIFEPYIEQDESPVRNLGWVHLNISRQRLQQSKVDIYIEGGMFFLIMLILAVLLTLVISHRIIQPIFTLLNHLKNVETGNLGELITNIEGNEIGDVQKGFNSMSQSLLANRKHLNQKIKTATLELMNAITDLEYKNRELGIARDIAQNADRVKSQFLANMSHEIRTPINGIIGFINLLSQTGLTMDQKRYADIISQSTRDLSVIVNEVLDFSKMESGKIEIFERPFDLFELLETTRNSLFASTLDKNVDLYLTIFSDTPRTLIGDKMRLKQILINLIGNAIKFTDQGIVTITVFMEDESADQIMIKFSIEDSGIGISDDDQKNLFKAFSQIESDTNRRFSGTGLGLVISKNLAHLMGGDIQLKSQIGSGSLFTLTLPFKPFESIANKPETHHAQTAMIYASCQHCLNELQSLYNRAGFNTETEIIEDQTTTDFLHDQLQMNLAYIDLVVFDLRHCKISPVSFIDKKVVDQCRVIIMHYDLCKIDSTLYPDFEFISVINTSNNLQQLLLGQPEETKQAVVDSDPQTIHCPNKILLVDDNPINLTLASELTRMWGHIAFEANNAVQAMQLFKREEFDLILLDIQMPEIDGIELMQMMRQQKPDLLTPIVAITANIMKMEKTRLMKLGFNAYISKPIDEIKFRALLDQQTFIFEDDNENNNKEELELNKDEAIDYNLTLRLSANNKSLAADIFRMMRVEIPGYQAQLKPVIEAEDKDKAEAILHKLQGVTCYAGLPRLKHLLSQYESAKKASPQDIFKICQQIIDELTRIDHILKQDFVAT